MLRQLEYAEGILLGNAMATPGYQEQILSILKGCPRRILIISKSHVGPDMDSRYEIVVGGERVFLIIVEYQVQIKRRVIKNS